MISLAIAANERTAQLTRTRRARGLERLASGVDGDRSRPARWRLRLGHRLVALGTTLLDGSAQSVSAAGR